MFCHACWQSDLAFLSAPALISSCSSSTSAHSFHEVLSYIYMFTHI